MKRLISSEYQIVKFDLKGKNAFVKLQNVEQATGLIRYLNGYQFYNHILHVDYSQQSQTNFYNEPSFQNMLQTFIESRYNPEDCILNLSNIVGEQNGYNFDLNKYGFVNTLLTAASKKCPLVRFFKICNTLKDLLFFFNHKL